MRFGDNVRLTGMPGAIIRLSGDGVFAMGVGSENIIVEGLTIERTGFAGISNFATALSFADARTSKYRTRRIAGHRRYGHQALSRLRIRSRWQAIRCSW